jgi:cell division protein FtsL
MPRPRQSFVSSTTQRRRTRRTASKPVLVALLLSAATVLGGVLLYLWPQMRLVHLGYRQNELRQLRTHMVQRQKELRVELGSLRQLPRMEEVAVQRLGLRPPQASQVIYVRSGQPIVSGQPIITGQSTGTGQRPGTGQRTVSTRREP